MSTHHSTEQLQHPPMNYAAALEAVKADARYQRNLDWGKPRAGHPEGTVRAHIAEIEPNLDRLAPKLSPLEIDKLRLLIHTHDSFKAEAEAGVPITHPASHASLARSFLAEFCDDADLLAMVQYHDEPFALWRQVSSKGTYNQERLQALFEAIEDWNLFLAFNIIDGCTTGKGRQPLRWFFHEIAGVNHPRLCDLRWTDQDIITD
ncbi:hypothetical protein A6X21_06330 [Planctopirus hydrillae]|uniref:HD domain-containing protein n=2 Tax=Planctopirus hydrillae TaxID=1841610 RepID=A0A1C3E9N1_9PLAN|nr:hypothetical protein A6X21_06330 [Planctopirus hydrillae]